MFLDRWFKKFGVEELDLDNKDTKPEATPVVQFPRSSTAYRNFNTPQEANEYMKNMHSVLTDKDEVIEYLQGEIIEKDTQIDHLKYIISKYENRKAKAPKKKVKQVDLILEVFAKTNKELKAKDVLKAMKWRKLKKEKPTTQAIHTLLCYLAKNDRIRNGLSVGTYCRKG